MRDRDYVNALFELNSQLIPAGFRHMISPARVRTHQHRWYEIPTEILQLLGYDGLALGSISTKNYRMFALKTNASPHRLRLVGEAIISTLKG